MTTNADHATTHITYWQPGCPECDKGRAGVAEAIRRAYATKRDAVEAAR